MGQCASNSGHYPPEELFWNDIRFAPYQTRSIWTINCSLDISCNKCPNGQGKMDSTLADSDGTKAGLDIAGENDE